MAKVSTWRRSWYRPAGHIDSTTLATGRQQHAGDVETTNGIVNVFALGPGSMHEGWTHLTYIRDGFFYNRVIDQFHAPRYIVTLAQRFTEDVISDTWEEEAENG